MRHDRERLDTEAAHVGTSSGGSPGKRALTDRLPPRAGESAAAGAGGDAERAGGGEHDDPFWWADGASAAEDGGGGTIDRATMQALYYGINPPRHAEKAYQAEDSAPPLHPRPTTVGKSGTIVALATTIYNRPPFGKVAKFSVCDRSGRALRTESVKTPGRVELGGFAPGTEVLIRPETIGTMVKLLTPEQIAGAEEREGDAANGAGAEERDGASAAEDGGGGTIDRATMQALYYGINPPRHAEKAYQAEDSAPPLHPRPTTVGKSGTIVALATTIYNRPPFGKVAKFSVCDRGGRALRTESVKTPGRVELGGFAPGTEVLIRPETIGTMVKLLTPEQIAGAEERDGDDDRG